jgi:hypothetical protein
MPCCGRRELSPKQQSVYDRAMIEAYADRNNFGQESPEARSALDIAKQFVREAAQQEEQNRAAKRAQEILSLNRGRR